MTDVDAAVAELDERHARQNPETAFTSDGDGRYRLAAPGIATFEADFLRRESRQLKAEVIVRCDLRGARTFDGVLAASDLNLSSTRTRSMHAKYLAERAQTEDVDWTGLLEEFAQRILAAERDGQPAQMLHEIPKPPPQASFTVDGLPLLARHPLVAFGDGGTAKSYLALYIAGTLAEEGHHVGYFDWELDGGDHRVRLERLFGANMPPIHYARCTRPLVYESDRLRRIIREEGLTYCVFDSVAFACDGPPESAEVAQRYFQALRQLGEIGSLHVAHITKQSDFADFKPFGSVFWNNGARATWNVKLADAIPGDGSIQIALHNRKANLGAKHPSIGFEITFGDGETTVRRVDVADVPDLAAGLTVRERMAHVLSRGPMPQANLAEEIDSTLETVSRTARRYKQQFVLLEGGKLALLEARR